MSDPQVINTLRNKARDLEAHIAKLDRAAAQARADLAHINAAIMLFQAPAAGEQFPMHFNLGMLFRGRELGQMCSEALASGPKSTRELAEYVIAKKELDPGDKALRVSIQLRIVNAMRKREQRGMATRAGKDRQAVVWCSSTSQ